MREQWLQNLQLRYAFIKKKNTLVTNKHPDDRTQEADIVNSSKLGHIMFHTVNK